MNEQSNPLRAGGTALLQVINVAHRGARAFAPENTLAAFHKAGEFGCDMIELDVHHSRDGELVVHHDDQLVRCTDAVSRWPGRNSYFVSDFSWGEIQSLDAGSWFVEELHRPAADRQEFLRSLTPLEVREFIDSSDLEVYRSGEIRIPSLGQVLEAIRSTGMLVNIELKTIPRMYPCLAEDVVALVRHLGYEHRVLISSFDHEQVVAVRGLSSVIATAVLTCDRLAAPGEYLERIDADAYNPGCYGDYDSLGFGSVSGALDARGITNAREHGRGVNAWTCNDPAQMSQLIDAGVTGVISDFPNRVRSVLVARR